MKSLQIHPLVLGLVVQVFAKSETRPPTNAHGFINYDMEFDPNNPCIPIEEEIIGMLDEIDDGGDNVQMGDVVVDRVGIKGAKSA